MEITISRQWEVLGGRLREAGLSERQSDAMRWAFYMGACAVFGSVGFAAAVEADPTFPTLTLATLRAIATELEALHSEWKIDAKKGD